jgi:hypothetical protein
VTTTHALFALKVQRKVSKGSKKKPRRAGPPVGGVSFKIRWERIAAQRPMTRLDRLTSSNLARALHSSCDGHHKKALFIAELR